MHLLSKGPVSPLKLILLKVLLWKLLRIPRFCFSLLLLPVSSAETSHTFIATAVVGRVEFTSSSFSGTVLLSVAIVCPSDSSLIPSFVKEPFSVMSISFDDLQSPPVSLFFFYLQLAREFYQYDKRQDLVSHIRRKSRNR